MATREHMVQGSVTHWLGFQSLQKWTNSTTSQTCFQMQIKSWCYLQFSRVHRHIGFCNLILSTNFSTLAHMLETSFSELSRQFLCWRAHFNNGHKGTHGARVSDSLVRVSKSSEVNQFNNLPNVSFIIGWQFTKPLSRALEDSATLRIDVKKCTLQLKCQ